jgi:iron complex transport system substrate-binding protein
VALALAAWLAAPAPAQADPVTVHDDQGRAVRLAAPAQRIVSLLPSLTESVCALGACERLVGVDRWANFPERVQRLPRLGGLEDAQIERIVALRPDLVLLSPSHRVAERLSALGLTVMVLESDTHAQVRSSMVRLAQVLGRPQAAGQAWAAIDAQVAAAAARVPAALRGQAVYFEVESSPYAAGAASFIGETLARLGLTNAVPADMGPFPKLNPEWVVRRQPALVMAVQRQVHRMPQRPGWATLGALTQGRHCGFEGPVFEMLVRPGPRLGETAERLADCLAALPTPAGSPERRAAESRGVNPGLAGQAPRAPRITDGIDPA